jgi:DnaJ-class molecular chaperone
MHAADVERDCAILGIDREDARRLTRARVRAAYRARALTTHPDKNGGKASCAVFHHVQEAYRRLMDHCDHRMEEEDGRHHPKVHVHATTCQPQSPPWMGWMLLWMLTMQRRKPRAIELTCRVSLEDVYHKRIKKLQVQVMRGMQGKQTACAETLYISLLNYRDRYVFEGKGDESCWVPGLRGDVGVTLEILPHPRGMRVDTLFSRYDLVVESPITLLEYYYGCRLRCPRVTMVDDDDNGEEEGEGATAAVTVSVEPEQRLVLMRGMGLPYYDEETEEERRGDLYVHLHLELPTAAAIRDVEGFRECLERFYCGKQVKQHEGSRPPLDPTHV